MQKQGGITCDKMKPMTAMKKVIVGLGNPGEEYANTYHNAGARALRAIAERLANPDALTFKTHKHLFEYAAVNGTALVLPLTFMNESGAAVKEAMKKFDAQPEDLIVLQDESDLPIGTYKISKERGAAGHKGIQSIMDALGSDVFMRVRIGIRPNNEQRRKKAEEFVLAEIKPSDTAALDKVSEEITREIAR